MPPFRPRIAWVARWAANALPEADVVVATAWQSAPIVAAAPARCGTKFYLVQHYESLYHGEPAAVDATYRLPLAKVVISTWLRDVMRERFDSDAEVLVTPVDRALFHRVPVEVTTSRPRVLMLHHEYAWKGVADGLAAVARVKAQVPGLWLVGFGVKPPRERLPYDEFHANPPQAALAALYSGCEVYLCPSWDEGLGMPPMEAMACGAALVTYDNGGCRDYARDGETALVAPRRDTAALAAALGRLATDAALRARIGAAGQAHVTTAFDWDRSVARLAALFQGTPAGADRA
jgi:glycosyltransferase involved in cell wall biosynthesis